MQELPHDGGDNDHFGLTSRLQARPKRPERWISTEGGERWKIQRVAQPRGPRLGEPRAAALHAGLELAGHEAGKGGISARAVELPNRATFREQPRSGARADPRNGD